MAAPWLQRRRPIVLTAAVLAVAGIVALRLGRPSAPTAPASEPSVMALHTVTALGTLVPISEVRTIAAPSSPAGQPSLLELRVEEGDRVRRGEILAVLDTHPRLLAAVGDAAAQVDLARTRLAVARADHREALLSQKARVRSLQAQLSTAEAELRRNQVLYDQGALSASDRDARQLTRDTAAAALQEARAELARQQAATGPPTSGGISLDVEVARKALAEAEANRQRARAELEESLIRAPIDGTVLSVLRRAGEAPDGEGILKIGETRSMQVVAEVYESDRQRIRLGQPVRISSPALETPLTARVTRIGRIVERQKVINTDPSSNTDSRVIEVRAALTPASNERAAGLVNLQVRAVIGP
jgi:HlyD family secretion protein